MRDWVKVATARKLHAGMWMSELTGIGTWFVDRRKEIGDEEKIMVGLDRSIHRIERRLACPCVVHPWSRRPLTSSCRYINSGAIIGVCAFAQGTFGPHGGPFERLLSPLPLSLSSASLPLTLPTVLPSSFSLPPSAPPPSTPLLLLSCLFSLASSVC